MRLTRIILNKILLYKESEENNLAGPYGFYKDNTVLKV